MWKSCSSSSMGKFRQEVSEAYWKITCHSIAMSTFGFNFQLHEAFIDSLATNAAGYVTHMLQSTRSIADHNRTAHTGNRLIRFCLLIVIQLFLRSLHTFGVWLLICAYFLLTHTKASKYMRPHFDRSFRSILLFYNSDFQIILLNLGKKYFTPLWLWFWSLHQW